MPDETTETLEKTDAIKPFLEMNPHCSASVDGMNVVVSNPWGNEDASLSFEMGDQEAIDIINNIILSPKFDGIIHADKNMVELFFGFVENSNDLINRSFEFHYEGRSIRCAYEEPSREMMSIARGFHRTISGNYGRSVPQIDPFKDFQNLDEADNFIKSYFTNKEPRNFFIKLDCAVNEIDLEILSRHINFLAIYYDRSSPIIEINQLEEDRDHIENIRYIDESFPESVVSRPIDEIILRLIEVARMTSPRYSFLYYYQVFEYAGYYYIEDKIKGRLRNFLKDPALINCREDKVSELFSMFIDLNHNDDVKMRKVIEDHCDPLVIWQEIENDKDFYASGHEFEGGFSLKPLISSDTTKSSWCAMWMPKLYDHMTKIRNALVHAREKREDKVILPTIGNNHLLKHYLPIMARAAEQIAIKS